MGMVTLAPFFLFFSIESKDDREPAFSVDTFSNKRSHARPPRPMSCWSCQLSWAYSIA
jgi:hypothetical protein